MGETNDIAYGSDPMLSDTIKMRRKAGLETLGKLLDTKDANAVMVFFATLVRELIAAAQRPRVPGRVRG